MRANSAYVAGGADSADVRTAAVLQVLSRRETVAGVARRLRAPEQQVADWCRTFLRAGLHGLSGPPVSDRSADWLGHRLSEEVRELRAAVTEAGAELSLWESMAGLLAGTDG